MLHSVVSHLYVNAKFFIFSVALLQYPVIGAFIFTFSPSGIPSAFRFVLTLAVTKNLFPLIFLVFFFILNYFRLNKGIAVGKTL